MDDNRAHIEIVRGWSQAGCMVLMIILLFIIGGCSEDAVGPELIPGHYILHSANGQDLPLRQFVFVSGGGGCALDLTAGSIHLSEADRYAASLLYFRDCPGVDADGTGSATSIGDYDVAEGTISFVPDSPSIIQLQQAGVSRARVEVQALWSQAEQLILDFRPE